MKAVIKIFDNHKDKVACILAAFTLMVFICAPVAADTTFNQDDLNSIINQTPFYDPNDTTAPNQCTSSGSGTTTITAGTGAPDGAAFPNLNPTAMANGINAWIEQQNPKSELNGLGSTIVADGQHSNVNPFLIVAIAHEESSLASPTDYNVERGNNSFGRSAAAGQPSFQGAMLWYKWTSVKASVDYTAPENQGISGGGDMGTYLRDRFGSQLDSNNLTALFLLYAPPGKNNTVQYIANVQGWILELVNLTTGALASSGASAPAQPTGTCPTTSTSTSTPVNCSSGGTAVTGDAAILCEAEKYNGIFYSFGGGHEGYAAFRKVCPEASIASAETASTAGDPGPCATDCSSLVSVSVDAVFGQTYNWTVSNSNGVMEGAGAQYWQHIPISQAQPGDIVTSNDGAGFTAPGDGHVEIVVSVIGSTVYSFGSHSTGTRTGPTTLKTSNWNEGAWHWTGPGSSG